MSNTQLLINQLHNVSTRGSLSTAYKITCKQLTKTLGLKRCAVDCMYVFECTFVKALPFSVALIALVPRPTCTQPFVCGESGSGYETSCSQFQCVSLFTIHNDSVHSWPDQRQMHCYTLEHEGMMCQVV